MTQHQFAHSPHTSTRSKVGMVALVLALIGGVLTFSVLGAPVLLFLSIPLLIAAFIVSIVAIARKNIKKGAAITALIFSVLFGILGPVFFASRFISDVGTAIAEGSSLPTDEEASSMSGIGERVENSDGVAFTVESVECGKSEIADEFEMRTEARGQFCVVSVLVENGSKEMVTLSTSDITGIIGDNQFETDSVASDLGGAKVLTNVNPGLSIDASFVIDVPIESTLEYLELRPTWSLQEPVLVRVS